MIINRRLLLRGGRLFTASTGHWQPNEHSSSWGQCRSVQFQQRRLADQWCTSLRSKHQPDARTSTRAMRTNQKRANIKISIIVPVSLCPRGYCFERNRNKTHNPCENRGWNAIEQRKKKQAIVSWKRWGLGLDLITRWREHSENNFIYLIEYIQVCPVCLKTKNVAHFQNQLSYICHTDLSCQWEHERWGRRQVTHPHVPKLRKRSRQQLIPTGIAHLIKTVKSLKFSISGITIHIEYCWLITFFIYIKFTMYSVSASG